MVRRVCESRAPMLCEIEGACRAGDCGDEMAIVATDLID